MKKFRLILMLFILPVCALAQGAQYTGIAQTARNMIGMGNVYVPIPGASVNVCTGVYTGTACPSGGNVAVYSNQALTTALPQPLTADNYGNFTFWAAPGAYYFTVTGQGAASSSYQLTLPFGVSGTYNATAKSIEQVRYADQFPGSDIGAEANAAIADLDAQGGIVVIPAGNYSLSTSMALKSNVTLTCQRGAVLTASAAFNAPMAEMFGVNHAGVIGCELSGDRASNSNSFFGIAAHDSSYLTIADNKVHDIIGNGIEIGTAVNHVTIADNEVYNEGVALPSQNGFGIAVSAGDYGDTGNVSDILLLNNRVHDSNFGFNVYNGIHGVVGLVMHGNKAWANADDGFRLQTFGGSNPGTIEGATLSDNEAWCNGWTGATLYGCTPGFLQTGATASSFGVGFDLIGWSTTRSTLSGNYAHQNVSDGFSNDGRTYTSVDTSGTAITLHTGGTYSDPFNTGWQAGEPVVINGQIYYISSVADSTHLTLTATAGTQSNVTLTGPALANNVFTGNHAYENGSNAVGGTGFWDDSADGDSWSGNAADTNWNAGFGAQHASFIAYANDRATDNNRKNSTENAGFYAVGLYRPAYTGISAADNTGTGYQAYGAAFDSGTSYAIVTGSPSLTGTTAAVLDSGSNDSWSDGLTTHGTVALNPKNTTANLFSVQMASDSLPDFFVSSPSARWKQSGDSVVFGLPDSGHTLTANWGGAWTWHSVDAWVYGDDVSHTFQVAGATQLQITSSGTTFTNNMSLASGKTFTNNGTISGGMVNATTLQQGGAAVALASQLPLSGSVAGSTTSLAANTCGDVVTQTVTGATTTMTPVVTVSGALPTSGLVIQAAVTAANTVSIEYCNVTTGSVIPAAATLEIRVVP